MRVSRIASSSEFGPPNGVALVEHEVEDVEHTPQRGRLLIRGRAAERNARRLDPLLRAADALRHRRLVDEERAGDLRGR